MNANHFWLWEGMDYSKESEFKIFRGESGLSQGKQMEGALFKKIEEDGGSVTSEWLFSWA